MEECIDQFIRTTCLYSKIYGTGEIYAGMLIKATKYQAYRKYFAKTMGFCVAWNRRWVLILLLGNMLHTENYGAYVVLLHSCHLEYCTYMGIIPHSVMSALHNTKRSPSNHHFSNSSTLSARLFTFYVLIFLSNCRNDQWKVLNHTFQLDCV